MKRIFTYLILFTLSISLSQAQRYDSEIYAKSEVQVSENVLYGFNYTVITIPSSGHTFKQPLVMDIYSPPASDLDEVSERPLVLLFHTGNFLPPLTNGQIAGTKYDSSAVEICTQLAQRGFVAASVEYRDGWNPGAQTQPERALGLIQAAYRGGQDGRNAIRFMKKTYAEDGNTYGIDTSKIATWGNGTGGYLILGMNGLSNFSEIITTTNGPGKFLLDVDMDGTPETPMVAPPYHGDLEGKVFTINPDAAYGLPPGDTTNFPNYVDYNDNHQLSINVGGALGDISWLDDQTIPIISVQSIDDIFAPYNDRTLIVPTTGDPIVQVQGLRQIGMSQEASGINQAWKDFNINDTGAATATTNAENWVNFVDSTEMSHPYYEGSFSWKKPNNSAGIDEGVVINWWNENDLSPPFTGAPGGAPWNMIPYPTGGTFHTNGLVLNEGMSAAKARANIAEIMDYVIPRACITLDLPCIVTSADEVILAQSLITMSPNPASGQVTISSVENEPIQNIEVYSISGQLISVKNDVNSSNATINVANQVPGMYIVKIYMENGFVTKKLAVK